MSLELDLYEKNNKIVA